MPINLKSKVIALRNAIQEGIDSGITHVRKSYMSFTCLRKFNVGSTIMIRGE